MVLLKSLKFLFITPAFLATSPSYGADSDYSHTLKTAQQQIQSGAISGVQLIVIEKGKIAAQYAGGITAAGQGQNTPLTMEQKVRVASISKMTVGLAIMKAREEGLLNLDDDISNYLPFTLKNPHFNEMPITIRQLLTHTSSLRDGDVYWLGKEEKLADFFTPEAKHYEAGAHFDKDHKPGDYFYYTNLNFGVLATILETVYQQRFDIILRQKVLQPLGLQASFNACDILARDARDLGSIYLKQKNDGTWDSDGPWRLQFDGDTVACYYYMPPVTRPAKGPVPFDLNLENHKVGKNGVLFSPQGGLRASAQDLATLMQLFINRGRHNGQTLFQPESIEMMLETQWRYNIEQPNGNSAGEYSAGHDPKGLMTEWGLSIHKIDPHVWGLIDRPYQLMGHTASAYGLLGQFWFDHDGNGLIVLINGTADDPSKAPSRIPLHGVESAYFLAWLKDQKHKITKEPS